MAELYLPPYCNNDLAQVSDADMSDILREIINDVMIENRVYYDDNDRAVAVEAIHPIISNIVFNPNFAHTTRDKELLLNIITHLVTHLS